MTAPRRLPLLAALSLSLVASFPAQAADSAGAKQLERVLETRLRELARPSQGTVHLERPVDAVVEPAGAGYRVTLPDLRLVMPEGQLLELGNLLLEATPRANGGWSFSGRLPSPIPVYSGEGFREGEVRIARQSFRGDWTGDLTLMDGIDLSLGGVGFTPREGKGTMKLDQLAVKAQPDDYRQNRWTGPATLSLQGLEVRDKQGRETFALDRANIRARLDRMDVDKLAGWNTAMGRLALADDGKEAMTNAERTALSQGLPNLEGLLGGLTLAGELDGLSTLAEDGTARKLRQVRWALDADALDRNRSSVSLEYSHDGLQLTGPQIRRDVVPARGSLRLNARSVPLTEILKAYRESVAEGARLGEQAASRRFESEAWEAAGRAGSTLNLDRFDFSAPDAAMRGTAAIRFADEAARGMTGTMDFLIRGFEALISQAQGRDMKAAGTVMALYALQGMGQAEGGESTRRYKLEIARDGRILLNGNDVTSIVTSLLSLR